MIEFLERPLVSHSVTQFTSESYTARTWLRCYRGHELVSNFFANPKWVINNTDIMDYKSVFDHRSRRTCTCTHQYTTITTFLTEESGEEDINSRGVSS